jgi:serine-type D-Ala-D-Ala carboxypeptidase (penicillin-binding protein 5/6)
LRYVLVLVLLLIIAAAVVAGVRYEGAVPTPSFKADVADSAVLPGTNPPLPWPSVGAAAIAVEGIGMVGSYGPTSPQAIASIAKVMTAELILTDHPLTVGGSGPNITFDASDVSAYQTDLSQSQSVVPVVAGESLSELQCLEAMLIPSANNVAVKLAQWDAGTVGAFVTKMNTEAKTLGMTSSTFTDPSGYQSTTMSNPSDLIKLGEAAMDNPVFASIVQMPQVTLPQAGTVYNYDYDLGRDGIVGIKTGSDSAAGGCFLFESVDKVGSRQIKLVGIVLGQQTSSPITAALNEAKALVSPTLARLQTLEAVPSGLVVGHISAPWASTVTVSTKTPMSVFGWAGQRFNLVLTAPSKLTVPVKAGQQIGTLVLDVPGHQESSPVVATGSISGPSASWRLER